MFPTPYDLDSKEHFGQPPQYWELVYLCSLVGPADGLRPGSLKRYGTHIPLPEFTARGLPRMQCNPRLETDQDSCSHELGRQRWYEPQRRLVNAPAVYFHCSQRETTLMMPLSSKLYKPQKNTESHYYFIFLFLNATFKSSNIQKFLWLFTHFVLSKVRNFSFEMKKIIPFKMATFLKNRFPICDGKLTSHLLPPKLLQSRATGRQFTTLANM